MSDEEMAAIRKRAEKATPGPWECRNAGGTTPNGEVIRLHRVRQRNTPGPSGPSALLAESDNHTIGCDQEDANMDFIAHAREDIPALLAENAALREIVVAVAALEARESERWHQVGLFHDRFNVLWIRDKARELLRKSTEEVYRGGEVMNLDPGKVNGEFKRVENETDHDLTVLRGPFLAGGSEVGIPPHWSALFAWSTEHSQWFFVEKTPMEQKSS